MSLAAQLQSFSRPWARGVCHLKWQRLREETPQRPTMRRRRRSSPRVSRRKRLKRRPALARAGVFLLLSARLLSIDSHCFEIRMHQTFLVKETYDNSNLRKEEHRALDRR